MSALKLSRMENRVISMNPNDWTNILIGYSGWPPGGVFHKNKFLNGNGGGGGTGD